MRIPTDLAALTADRRLIPFVGAGFSSGLGLPTWESMLSQLCERIEGSMSFEDLQAATGGDNLQIAEYLFLKSDKRIGPLRRQIERSLVTVGDPILSGPHVELVNLGAAQIYTTNYDDIIESTFRALDVPVNTVVLPRDVALADTTKTQVVKYHGDLEHEHTLVLTESAYYKRLEFESPMDLKFRSDLLGKSVLFMGYSFRDLNIRVIWFKLMEMMRDVPASDRTPSYIVRMEPNPALEELYSAVGLNTVVLDPRGRAASGADRSRLLGDFLLELSQVASPTTIPGTDRPCFVSSSLLDATSEDDLAKRAGVPDIEFLRRFGHGDLHDLPPFRRLLLGNVPDPLTDAVANRLAEFGDKLISLDLDESVRRRVFEELASKSSLTTVVVRLLAAQGGDQRRSLKRAMIDEVDWAAAWSGRIDIETAEALLDKLEAEIEYQRTQMADEDIAYLADLGVRLARGDLIDPTSQRRQEVVTRAASLVASAADVYSAISALVPSNKTRPVLDDVLIEVESRAKRQLETVAESAPAGGGEDIGGGAGESEDRSVH